MSKEEALAILGLKEGFSETELKKAYQNCAKKYHPDNHMNESKESQKSAEEQMKKVNAAYDYLIKLKKRQDNYEKELELDNYRRTILAKMNAFFKDSFTADLPLMFKIKAIAEEKARLLPFRLNKYGIDSVYEGFLKEVRREYEIYKKYYYEENGIFEEDVKEPLNYEYRVNEFYDQLVTIKNKYSRKLKFERRVNAEIEQYKSYSIYTDFIGQLISVVCVHNANVLARKNNYENIEAVIAAMHKEILELFKIVEEINTLFSKLEEELKEVVDQELKNEFEKIKKEYKEVSLIDTENHLKKLAGKIENYKKTILANEPIIKEIYIHLLENFQKAASLLSPVKDYDKMKQLINFYRMVMGAFDQFIKGKITLEKLLLLNNLTFNDLEKDRELLWQIFTKEESAPSPSNIYIHKPNFNMEKGFYLLEMDSAGKLWLFGPNVRTNNLESFEVTLGGLQKNYISLDDFIKIGSYVGMDAKRILDEQAIFVLYKVKVQGFEYYIILENDEIKCVTNEYLTNFNFYHDKTIYEKYQDVEYVKSLIEEQIQYQKRKIRTKNRKIK